MGIGTRRGRGGGALGVEEGAEAKPEFEGRRKRKGGMGRRKEGEGGGRETKGGRRRGGEGIY